jgi:hypothetical protein
MPVFSTATSSFERSYSRPAPPERDPDTSASKFDITGDAVAVDDDLRMTVAAFKKRGANPTQVGQRLPLDRHAGPDPRMNEEIVAGAEAVREAAQE